MAPPSSIHQKLVRELTTEINLYIRSKNGSCEVLPSPFAVFLNEDDSTYVEPDISVICDRNKITNKGCLGAPNWIIEIVSPSSKSMDYYTKLMKYREAGVNEYWIVDPLKEMILVYYLEIADSPTIYRFDDIVKANIYEDLEIDFKRLNF
jgi:Uma2 family endonuclease